MILMDGGLVILLVLSLGTVIFVIQRTEAKRRRIVLVVMFLVLLVLGWLVNIQGAWGEAVVGLLIALILNGLFYILIGRYNPVGSSDDKRGRSRAYWLDYSATLREVHRAEAEHPPP